MNKSQNFFHISQDFDFYSRFSILVFKFIKISLKLFSSVCQTILIVTPNHAISIAMSEDNSAFLSNFMRYFQLLSTTTEHSWDCMSLIKMFEDTNHSRQIVIRQTSVYYKTTKKFKSSQTVGTSRARNNLLVVNFECHISYFSCFELFEQFLCFELVVDFMANTIRGFHSRKAFLVYYIESFVKSPPTFERHLVFWKSSSA